MSVTVDIAKLEALINDMPQMCAAIVKKGALAVEGAAKSRAPIDTGALMNSISGEPQEPLLWYVSPGVEYAAYQEFGTYKMPAHPYMLPAADRVRPQYEKLWATLIKGRV